MNTVNKLLHRTNKSPTMTTKKYRVRYRQVPYDNRYYKFDYKNNFGKWVEFATVPTQNKNLANILLSTLFSYRFHGKALEYFEGRVHSYDEYLDQLND